MIISHLGPSWGLLGAYRGPERARLSSEQPYFGEVGENDLWARRRPQRLQVTLKHFTGVIIHDYKSCWTILGPFWVAIRAPKGLV